MQVRLTPREVECVLLAGERLSNDEIATRLGLSPRTVANHMQSAFAKLGVNSRRAAAGRLVNLYPEQRMTMASAGDLDPDRATDPEVVDGLGAGTTMRDRGLYRRYAALGQWRTPPRWGSRRIGPMIVTALLLAGFIGIVSMSLRSCVELIDTVQGRPLIK